MTVNPNTPTKGRAMTNHPHNRGSDNRSSRRRRAVALSSLIGVAAVVLAACGGNHSDTLSSSQRAQAEAELIAYAKCMRSHGASDFPDPSASSAGGIGYSNAQAQAINQNRDSSGFCGSGWAHSWPFRLTGLAYGVSAARLGDAHASAA
jgi:hypothetical protein